MLPARCQSYSAIYVCFWFAAADDDDDVVAGVRFQIGLAIRQVDRDVTGGKLWVQVFEKLLLSTVPGVCVVC